MRIFKIVSLICLLFISVFIFGGFLGYVKSEISWISEHHKWGEILPFWPFLKKPDQGHLDFIHLHFMVEDYSGFIKRPQPQDTGACLALVGPYHFRIFPGRRSSEFQETDVAVVRDTVSCIGECKMCRFGGLFFQKNVKIINFSGPTIVSYTDSKSRPKKYSGVEQYVFQKEDTLSAR